jgi:serine/threonine protein kinase
MALTWKPFVRSSLLSLIFADLLLAQNNTQIGICMEYCEAGSLDSLYKKVKDRGWRTGEKVLGKIAESILSGLVYLHDQKIIHRGSFCLFCFSPRRI